MAFNFGNGRPDSARNQRKWIWAVQRRKSQWQDLSALAGCFLVGLLVAGWVLSSAGTQILHQHQISSNDTTGQANER